MWAYVGYEGLQERHLCSRANFKLNRAAALAERRQLLTRIDLGCASNLMRVLICLTAPTAEVFQKWLTKVGIKPIRIYPGSPWENGYNERFNGTLRREILDAGWFVKTKQAQTAINVWLKQYNQIRPHQALNMRPPVPETLLKNGT